MAEHHNEHGIKGSGESSQDNSASSVDHGNAEDAKGKHPKIHNAHTNAREAIGAQHSKQTLRQAMHNIYDKHYKTLLILPFLMLILGISQIAYQIISTSYYLDGDLHMGDFVNKGVSLKGGISITLGSDELDLNNIDINGLEKTLASSFPNVDLDVREQSQLGTRTGLLVDISIEKQEEIERFKEILKESIPGLMDQSIDNNIASIGSSLGADFFKQTIKALIFAFVLMSIIVFFYFRIPIPCIAIILAAVSDIIVTLAIFNIIGFKLSTAGIAAFLMLVGYSVDTDILLASRVLRSKEGTVLDRIYSALFTGLKMTFTTLTALIVAIIFIQSPELKQLMYILLIGLVVDIINTWIQNVGILRWYLESKGIK